MDKSSLTLKVEKQRSTAIKINLGFVKQFEMQLEKKGDEVIPGVYLGSRYASR